MLHCSHTDSSMHKIFFGLKGVEYLLEILTLALKKVDTNVIVSHCFRSSAFLWGLQCHHYVCCSRCTWACSCRSWRCCAHLSNTVRRCVTVWLTTAHSTSRRSASLCCCTRTTRLDRSAPSCSRCCCSTKSQRRPSTRMMLRWEEPSSASVFLHSSSKGLKIELKKHEPWMLPILPSFYIDLFSYHLPFKPSTHHSSSPHATLLPTDMDPLKSGSLAELLRIRFSVAWHSGVSETLNHGESELHAQVWPWVAKTFTRPFTATWFSCSIQLLLFVCQVQPEVATDPLRPSRAPVVQRWVCDPAQRARHRERVHARRCVRSCQMSYSVRCHVGNGWRHQ